jgi:hypothetical protein
MSKLEEINFLVYSSHLMLLQNTNIQTNNNANFIIKIRVQMISSIFIISNNLYHFMLLRE